MQVGDLVTRNICTSDGEVPGIVIEILPCTGIPDPGMVKVLWCRTNATCRNDNLYRAEMLFLFTEPDSCL